MLERSYPFPSEVHISEMEDEIEENFVPVLHESRVFSDVMVENLKLINEINFDETTVILEEVNLDLFHCVYDRNSLLGVGSFGSVYRGTLIGTDVAVKRIRKVNDDQYELFCKQLRREAVSMQLHSFPGVIQFFGTDDEDNPSLIVMELAVCSLNSALHSSKYADQFDWTEESKIRILLECCNTLAVLHSVGIVHRDIKSKNVLMMPNGHVKITGFRAPSTELYAHDDNRKGVLSYLAPELLEAESFQVCDQFTDMYAFAVLMNEVMSGQKAFDTSASELKALMKSTQYKERPSIYTENDDMAALIERCWDTDRRKRWRFRDVALCLEKMIEARNDIKSPPTPPPNVLHEPITVESVFLGSSLLSGYYTGDMRGYQRHGWGRLLCLDGSYYEAHWRNDELHGFGQMVRPGVFYFEGNFVNSQRNGAGVWIFENGDVYDCQWKNDLMHGYGVTIVSGGRYEGEFRCGLKEGRGVLKFANGDEYDGDWVDDKKEGQGVCMFVNGSSYEGGWKNDMKEGRGVMSFASGAVYEGEWKADLKDGYGVYRFAMGDVYDGEWLCGVMEGRGVYRFSHGDVYDGEWKSGKRHGRGVLTFSNGAFYDGDWVNGVMEGRGVGKFADGDVYEGEWKSGVREGHGVLTFVDGDMFEGDWSNGEVELDMTNDVPEDRESMTRLDASDENNASEAQCG